MIAEVFHTLVVQPTTLCKLDCGYCYLPDRRRQRFEPVDVFVAFADNLYPGDNPVLTLAQARAGRTMVVLARPYRRAEAPTRGVIVSRYSDGEHVLTDLVEKPLRNHGICGSRPRRRRAKPCHESSR